MRRSCHQKLTAEVKPGFEAKRDHRKTLAAHAAVAGVLLAWKRIVTESIA
jgi:hypothetical protein